MKLPNGENAVVDIAKLRDYCLSSLHPRGRHKARVFGSKLGMSAKDADDLKAALQIAAKNSDAVPRDTDEYGQRYLIDFTLHWQGNQAMIRSSWIILANESFPRLTSCYVL